MRLSQSHLAYWSSFGDGPSKMSFGNFHRLYWLDHISISWISLQLLINWPYSNKDSILHFQCNVEYNVHRYNSTQAYLVHECYFKWKYRKSNNIAVRGRTMFRDSLMACQSTFLEFWLVMLKNLAGWVQAHELLLVKYRWEESWNQGLPLLPLGAAVKLRLCALALPMLSPLMPVLPSLQPVIAAP